MAARLAHAGALAVVLTGSHARGDAQPESDVDLVALGEGTSELRWEDGHLVSVAWQTVAACRAAFHDPPAAGTVVPGWRQAIILHDPQHLAATMQQEAVRWTWAPIAYTCDAWVAAEVTGFAEEVHKLVVALRAGRRWTAAVQRSLLALRMARIIAVHRRLLYATENHLWNLVAAEMGAEWRALQAAALGDDDAGGTLEASAAAALALYHRTATEVWPLLTAPQAAVVAHACALAGHRLPGV